MAKFTIDLHFRLQEWVAKEKGYFEDEKLDYVFQERIQSTDGEFHNKGDKYGAYQLIEAGRYSDVSCACHWTVNVAAANKYVRLYPKVYSIAPCGIFVAADSDIKKPQDLEGVPISVGYQSGSHYFTIQALAPFISDKVHLSFTEGMLFKRMELLLNGEISAAVLFNGPYYLAEQLGFRKILASTFMITTMIAGEPDPEDLKKYFRALKRAQHDIDLRPELYTHYYKNEFPVRFHSVMDTRGWGSGERLVFDNYTEDTYYQSREWIAKHSIFESKEMGTNNYNKVIF